MGLTEDYTIKNGLGVRVNGRKTCQAIRKQKNEWTEIGKLYELPVDAAELSIGTVGIPASVLAVAVRAYELDHPGSKLRAMLTRRIARPRLLERMVASA